jgi:hypothetical protein
LISRSLCRVGTCFVVAILGGVVLVGPATAQRRERTLIVSALDKASGMPVETLHADDVVVREDGVASEVIRVTRLTDPMQVAVLIDNSAAAGPHIGNIRDGLKAFVAALDKKSELSLVTYADRPTLIASFSTDRREMDKGIDRVFPQSSSGAYLLEAIQETARGFVKRRARRPVIVVVSMAGVEFSTTHYEPVLERLEESGAQLHVLGLVDHQADETDANRYRNILVDRGTSETGGRRQDLLATMALPQALKSLAAELNGQFRAVYVRPDSLIQPRNIEVGSGRPELEVRGSVAREPR